MNYEIVTLAPFRDSRMELEWVRMRSLVLVRQTEPSWWAKHWEREDDL